MRRFALVLLTIFAVQPSLVAQPANPKPKVKPGAPAATSPESARQHLTRLFAEVAAENRGTDKSRTRYFSSSYSFNFEFPTWSLHDGDGPSLRQSLALEALSIELNAPRQDDRALMYVQAAVRFLEDSNPKRRALAAELLAMVPIHTLESGAIEKLAPLLDDNAVAWVGLGLGGAQWGQRADVRPVDVTVAQVASAALPTLTPFRFPDATTFRRWWQANKDVRSHPWYWSARWRTTPADKDLAALEGLDVNQALRMLLLASNEEALLADARRSAGPQLPNGFNWRGSGSGLATAQFVRRHGISDKLLDVLDGDIPWGGDVVPEAQDDLARTALGVLRSTIAPKDLPRLKQLLQTPKGKLAADETLLLSLTRVAMQRLPADHEQILVSLVEANPGRQLIALELLEETGNKHWELIKRSYVTPPTSYATDGRHGMIRSAPLVTGGKQCLAELFALDNLEIVPPNQDGGGLRFQAFVEAVNFHSRIQVISAGELDSAIYRGGKGGDRRPEEIIAAVAENRRAVLKKLRKYLSGE